jgi:hypothetical protein
MKENKPANEKRKWRKDHTFVRHPSLESGEERGPNFQTGRSDLYCAGAVVTPISKFQRRPVTGAYRNAPTDARFKFDAWFKLGHLSKAKALEGWSTTAEEGMEICNRWLDEQEQGQDQSLGRHEHERRTK